MSEQQHLTRKQADELGLEWAPDWAARGYFVARMPPECRGLRVLMPGTVLDEGDIPGLGRCRVVRMLNRQQVLLERIPDACAQRSEEVPSAAAPPDGADQHRGFVAGIVARLVGFIRCGAVALRGRLHE
jgi:hypothetical protein